MCYSRDMMRLNVTVKQIANKNEGNMLLSGLALPPLITKIFRVFFSFFFTLFGRKTPPLRAFKCANNRDFRFYATINRGLLVPFCAASREFTSADV